MVPYQFLCSLYSPPFRACSTHALSMNVHAHTSENSVDLSRPRRLSPIKRQNLLISTSTSSFALKSAPGDSLGALKWHSVVIPFPRLEALSVLLWAVSTQFKLSIFSFHLYFLCAPMKPRTTVWDPDGIGRSPNACLGKTLDLKAWIFQIQVLV